MKQQIKEQIKKVIVELYPEYKDIDFSVDYAPESTGADLASNAAMILAKKLHRKPMEIAEEIVEEFKGEGGDKGYSVESVNPGFINFRLPDKHLVENLKRINKEKDKYGQNKSGKGKLAIVEYFQLNVAKPPHVGHLRSAVIGDSLKRILQYVGYKTVSDTHIGDWGTQFGLLLLAYKTLDGKNRVKDNPLEELNRLYVEINKKMEDKPELLEAGKREFVKLEQGDKENWALWEFFVRISKKKFDEMKQALQLEHFEKENGESFYRSDIKPLLNKLETHGLLKKGETGEIYVDLERYGLGRLICIKSDGASTYEARDLATFVYRYDEWGKKNLAWNLYVVDTRQSHDFKQVFKTMEMLGYDILKSKHVDFGFMSLPEGALSTRKGNIISLEKLIEEARNRAKKIIEEKNPQLKGKGKVAEAVAMAAIKYFDLKHNRKSDIVFNWEEALSFEGNTGPYLQYTHARLRSILRKVKGRIREIGGIGEIREIGGEEQTILRKLAQFEDVIIDTAEQLLPNALVNYLFELAEKINFFYHKVPVIQEENKYKKGIRLALVAATAQVLKNGLNLLGIEAPEEM